MANTFTLTAKLTDVTGATIGTTSNPAGLRIVLCGFGQTLPCVAGTANFAQIVQQVPVIGTASVVLIPNNLITPGGTYYEISVIDGQGNVLQSGIYQIDNVTGSPLTVDLSELEQIIQPTVAGGTWVQKEYLTGTSGYVSSVTLTYPHAPGSLVMIYITPNGGTATLKLFPGEFSVSGSTVTFSEPQTGTIDVVYWTALG